MIERPSMNHDLSVSRGTGTMTRTNAVKSLRRIFGHKEAVRIVQDLNPFPVVPGQPIRKGIQLVVSQDDVQGVIDSHRELLVQRDDGTLEEIIARNRRPDGTMDYNQLKRELRFRNWPKIPTRDEIREIDREMKLRFG